MDLTISVGMLNRQEGECSPQTLRRLGRQVIEHIQLSKSLQLGRGQAGDEFNLRNINERAPADSPYRSTLELTTQVLFRWSLTQQSGGALVE